MHLQYLFFYIQDGQRDDSLIVDKDDSLKKISIQNPDCNYLARWSLRYLSSFKQTEKWKPLNLEIDWTKWLTRGMSWTSLEPCTWYDLNHSARWKLLLALESQADVSGGQAWLLLVAGYKSRPGAHTLARDPVHCDWGTLSRHRAFLGGLKVPDEYPPILPIGAHGLVKDPIHCDSGTGSLMSKESLRHRVLADSFHESWEVITHIITLLSLLAIGYAMPKKNFLFLFLF